MLLLEPLALPTFSLMMRCVTSEGRVANIDTWNGYKGNNNCDNSDFIRCNQIKSLVKGRSNSKLVVNHYWY